ncbi:UPF0462 protein C4orf33 homolog [Poecilia formosa]|uniref:Chromosome 4 open reading frame 33 n=1 Tax=Poecilia formosa TaxID=48698 RepID=A0A087YAX5_POEFO|nr:PREDICTED: UPF0462 protein C4orf33 homolog [Poecilia formosa]
MAVTFQLLALVHILLCCGALHFRKMEFAIQHTWDSNPVDHEPIRLAYSDGRSGLKIEVSGPFFKGFHPPAEPGLPDLSLRIYEVASSVFLDSTKNNYLEVVLCPYGQHLIVLKAAGYPLYQLLPIEFTTTITGDTWQGQALIPWTYFPPNVNKMNCYASHGIRENRTHEALYPVPKEDLVEGLYPDAIYQEYFQNFRLQSIMGEDWVQPESDLWRGKA